MTYAQPWSPVDAEMRLRAIDAGLDAVVAEVKRARDVELKHYRAFRDAKTDALLREDRPRVTRGGTTTAELAAWVDREVRDAEWDYEQAKKAREDAIDDMFKLKDQGMIVGKVSDLVRQAYATAGGR